MPTRNEYDSPRLGVRAAAHIAAIVWLGHVSLASLVVVFRAVKNAGIAGAIQFDDVPLLRYFDTHYDGIFDWLLLSSITVLAITLPGLWWGMRLRNPLSLAAWKGNTPAQQSTLALLIALILFELCLLRASQPYESTATTAVVDGVTLLDWTAVLSLAVIVWCLPAVLTGLMSCPRLLPPRDLRGPRSSRILRNGWFYLFGSALVFVYGWIEHVKFWDPEKNGGYKYAQFFLEDELPQAELVLYSTSVLFATLAAVGGCVLIALFRCVANRAAAVEPGERDENSGRTLTLLSAFTWALMLHLPWQIKLWPEIEAERGWILPAVTILFTAAAVLPAMQISWLSLTRDFRDFAEEPVYNVTGAGKFVPRPSELALCNFVLFPVYPLLSLIRIPAGWLDAMMRRAAFRIGKEQQIRAAFLGGSIALLAFAGNREFFSGLIGESKMMQLILQPDISVTLVGIGIAVCLFQRQGRSFAFLAMLLAAGGVGVYALTMTAYKADDLFTFDDWRGMLKSGLFPFLRVTFALMSASFTYVVLRRLLLVIGAAMRAGLPYDSDETLPGIARFVAKSATLLLVGGSLALATWPFWGWNDVRRNVFTRCAEYNSRHDFELRFLHWLFDYDRDGYSAVLHGADPDDFDASVQPGRIPPPRDDNEIPFDKFTVADPVKAQRSPSLIILFLEGVTREAISAYGKRTITGTPNMDRIAADGTIFTQARCFYPSTWDAWYSTITGRYLRIKEFDMSRGFGNRYCRFGNLYKVMQLAGVRRYCHSNTDPFYQVCVPMNLRGGRKRDWMPNFDSSVSDKEEKAGVWRGDKRNRRMLKFLDDLEPGERFFITEHMSDTHFPWNRVKGYEWASGDAVLKNGSTDEKYSHYFQAIARMDAQIGELIDKLKQIKRYDDTMIVIVSDHGCQWWEHEHMYYVSHLYDQSLLVPLIVKIPGIKGGRVVNEPVLQVDILPTYMQAAGVAHRNPDGKHPFPGVSLVPLMRGTATEQQKRACRERDVPLTTHYDKLGVLSQMRHKLIFNRPVGTYKLFDLKTDPDEKHNLVDENPELLRAMIEKLRVQITRHPTIIGGIKKDASYKGSD